MDGWIVGWIYEMYVSLYVSMYGWMDRWMDGWMDFSIYGSSKKADKSLRKHKPSLNGKINLTWCKRLHNDFSIDLCKEHNFRVQIIEK